jgi:AcrR family transcriptional regulator
MTRKNQIPNTAGQETPALKRGPKPGLSRTEIARAAIALADKEGLAAVTMQRIAHEVGVSTMALYRYFPDKADLVAVMIDSAGDAAGGFGKASILWKNRLREWARRCAAIYRDHPWFLEATASRKTIMGPNELSWMEAALGMLAQAGLSPAEQYYAFLAIIGHVRGHATFQQKQRHGESPRRWGREMAHLLRSESGRFPALLAALDSGALSGDSSEAFDYGLNCILDGIPATKLKGKRSLPARAGNRNTP